MSATREMKNSIDGFIILLYYFIMIPFCFEIIVELVLQLVKRDLNYFRNSSTGFIFLVLDDLCITLDNRTFRSSIQRILLVDFHNVLGVAFVPLAFDLCFLELIGIATSGTLLKRTRA